jgi:hypothetical protein
MHLSSNYCTRARQCFSESTQRMTFAYFCVTILVNSATEAASLQFLLSAQIRINQSPIFLSCFQRYRSRQAEPLILKHSHVSVALVLASLGTQDVLAGQGFPSKQSPSKDRRLSAPCGLHRFWGNHIDDNSTPIYRRECPRTEVSSLEVSRLGKNSRNFGIDTLSLNLRENLGASSL